MVADTSKMLAPAGAVGKKEITPKVAEVKE